MIALGRLGVWQVYVIWYLGAGSAECCAGITVRDYVPAAGAGVMAGVRVAGARAAPTVQSRIGPAG